MHRVIIIEPSEIIQTGLRSALDFGRKFEIVGCYNDLQRVEQYMISSRADIVIINPNVVQYSRRGNIRTLFNSNIIVIALASGYMDGGIIDQFDSIIDLYEPLCRIEGHLNNVILHKEIIDDDSTILDQGELSDREKEILIELLKGLTNKEIAQYYNISIHTVISHRKNITRKTGIKSLSGLTVYALLNNLIAQSDISAQ